MTTSIARQSVIIKCNMQCAYLLGNYEFYYAAGLACKLYGLEVDRDSTPTQLVEFMQENLQKMTPSNDKEQYLTSILQDYMAEDRYDEDMKELLVMGLEEKNLWQVIV